MKLVSGNVPDITPAQIAAVVGWIVAQLVAYGVLDIRYQQLAVSIGATVLGAAWKFADAYLRGQRAKALLPKPAVPPVNPPA